MARTSLVNYFSCIVLYSLRPIDLTGIYSQASSELQNSKQEPIVLPTYLLSKCELVSECDKLSTCTAYSRKIWRSNVSLLSISRLKRWCVQQVRHRHLLQSNTGYFVTSLVITALVIQTKANLRSVGTLSSCVRSSEPTFSKLTLFQSIL